MNSHLKKLVVTIDALIDKGILRKDFTEETLRCLCLGMEKGTVKPVNGDLWLLMDIAHDYMSFRSEMFKQMYLEYKKHKKYNRLESLLIAKGNTYTFLPSDEDEIVSLMSGYKYNGITVASRKVFNKWHESQVKEITEEYKRSMLRLEKTVEEFEKEIL